VGEVDLGAGEGTGLTPAPEAVPVDVHVWSLDDPPRTEADMMACLSPEELARADRFKFPHLRRRWIAARGGMRMLLGAHAGLAPETLSFETGEHGKPFLTGANGPCTFNLSHSDSLAALAISSVELGVDIEVIGRFHEGVARDRFSASENAALQRLPEDGRNAAFYHFWTAKEAVLKALGTGFSRASDSFTIDISDRDALQLVEARWPEGNPGTWFMRAFEPGPGFAGAVAVRTGRPVCLAIAHWA
jgi:4'-phosphopantetheinyl transferase